MMVSTPSVASAFDKFGFGFRFRVLEFGFRMWAVELQGLNLDFGRVCSLGYLVWVLNISSLKLMSIIA